MSEWQLTKQVEDFGKVAVLLGGNSAERDISLMSGEAIFQALLSAGVDAVKIDPKEGLYEQVAKHQIDRAFIALHGRDGEDGVVQGFLQTLGIPFTGSSVAGASLSMDKLLSKKICKQSGIKTAHFAAVSREQAFTEVEARRLFAKLGPVLFVKPVKEGSSVGMSKVKDEQSLIDAIKLAHQYDYYALIESFISGREYTVSILKDRVLPSISMVTPREFYDYEAKYHSTETQYFCPSGLTDDEESQLQARALAAFKALGCQGWGRVDFIRDGEVGEFLFLEANTVPGMTQTSLVPKAAKAVGIDFKDLVLHILETSFS